MGDLVQFIFPAFRGIAQGKDEAYVDLDVGLSVISAHAKSLGYDALILFLDELILWLATHSADIGFVQTEGNKLAKLVESRKSDRPVPIISFVARQRDLRELIGENVTGVEQLNFSDVLSHWEGRFHTITLEDRNLPVIAQKRVLRPKNDACRAELEEAFEKTAQVRQEIMEVLLTREADRAMFKLVYPFSPALMQALVAVSSALQRERTALKIMLQLLVNRRDTLRLGDVIPLGDLWDVVAHGDEAFTDVMRVNFENAKNLYQNKLRPLLEQQHQIDLEVDRERADGKRGHRRPAATLRERRPAHQEPAAVRPGAWGRVAQEHDLHAAGRTQPRDDPVPHSGAGASGRRPEAPHLGGHGRRDPGGRGADESDRLDPAFGCGYRGDHRGGHGCTTTSATASSSSGRCSSSR